MTYNLGLDLGAASMAATLTDEKSKKILAMIVRTFQAGVEKLGEGENEESRSAQRRQARNTRKQIFRRKLRKKMLLKLLQENGMAPEKETLKEWFTLHPVEIRSKAVKEKVTLPELGRALYHMGQRRGFPTNSRSANAGVDKKTKLNEGNAEEGIVGIDQTRREIGDQTLGEALFAQMVKPGVPYKAGSQRIRKRYTVREMYTDEFEKIWNYQEKYYPELNSSLKEALGGRKKEGYTKDGILFFQRELRSQKHLVGKCSLEKNKTRIPLSAIPFEKYRAWSFINNIRCNGKSLSQSQKQKAFDFLMKKDSPKISELRKKLELGGENYNLNYENEDKCPGAYTISKISSRNYFGEKWHDIPPEKQEEIWHTLYFFEDQEKLKDYAKEKWGLEEKNAEAISKIHLKQGFGSLSRKAVNNILPFLEMGFQSSDAMALGGVRNALGDKWELLTDAEKQLILDNVPEIVASNNTGGYLDPLRNFLQTEFGMEEHLFKKLYHPDTNIRNGAVVPFLPLGKDADKEIQQLRNPVVITALFELRKLVNAIIKEHGKPAQINIELARDLKSNKKQRNATRKKQQQQEKFNRVVEKELEDLVITPTYDNRLKYKLWQECGRICPYTGKSISVTMLFETGEVQIEHIFPLSRSNDDSYLNKTLCFAEFNNEKGNRTPYECFKDNGWEGIKERAKDLFKYQKDYPDAYKKFRRFTDEKICDDFTQRQLNDTRYISREARKYLQKICKNVNVASGGITARLRHLWGLNKVLFEETKERTDHRHHAIDALVLACLKPRHIQQLAHRNEHSFNPDKFPRPWVSFWEDAKNAVDDILVTHRPNKRILTKRKVLTKKNGKAYINKTEGARGSLHKEGIYGKRRAPGQEEDGYHMRKSLQKIQTDTHVNKIVDKVIQKLVIEHLKKLGVDTSGKYSIPSGAFFTSLENGTLLPRLFLPNKNGDPVPIKSVRIRENHGNAEKLKETNQWVNLRNNHQVLIYRDKEGNLKEEVLTFWQAAERKKNREAVAQLPADGVEIITTLRKDDMFLLNLKKEGINWSKPDKKVLNKHLYKVRKLSSKLYYFTLHSDTTGVNEKIICSFGEGKAGWLTLNPIKVRLDVTGKILPI